MNHTSSPLKLNKLLAEFPPSPDSTAANDRPRGGERRGFELGIVIPPRDVRSVWPQQQKHKHKPKQKDRHRHHGSMGGMGGAGAGALALTIGISTSLVIAGMSVVGWGWFGYSPSVKIMGSAIWALEVCLAH